MMGAESRNGHGWEEREDDWFAEKGELDWLDDPRGEPAAVSAQESPQREGDQRGQPGRREGPERPSPRATPAIIARRRRILALAIVGLLAVTVIAVLVATSGGGRQTEATPTASTLQPTREQATGTATSRPRPVQTQPTSTSTPLQVTLPASGKLSIGDSGSDVMTLQKALTLLGYNLGTPDGNFGSMTQAALASFQTTYGLPPDGILGAATAKKLNQLLAARLSRD